MDDSSRDSSRRELLHHALINIRHNVVALHQKLKLNTGVDLDAFKKVLDSKLLVRLSPDYPLMVAITGGGSTGKSSLFNALVGERISAVKAKAGLSRRVLAAINPSLVKRQGFLASLFEPFGNDPEPLNDTKELTEPGVPKYMTCPNVSTNLVLLDTPDFDTGDQNDFTNRGAAKPVLEACDVLVYIFTNATYNNRANTEFIRSVLTDIGNRKAILVYRCSRTFTEQEIKEHSDVVTRNVYGDAGEKWRLGIYRVHEDDEVAKGEALMTIRALDGSAEIAEILAKLDPAQTRADFFSKALGDIRNAAVETLNTAKAERLKVEIYRDAIRIATSWATTAALEAYPQGELLQQFLQVWEKGQPLHIKFAKGTGKIIKRPFEWIRNTVRDKCWKEEPPPTAKESAEDVFKKKFLMAANDLRNKLLGRDLVVETTKTDPQGSAMVELVKNLSDLPNVGTTMPRVEEIGDGKVNIHAVRPLSLENGNHPGEHSEWKPQLDRIVKEAEQLWGVSEAFDKQLEEVAAEFRAQMGWKSKLRETFTASLVAIPPIVGVTYVLMTGDPVGGSGIYAHLAALFGMNDLYALLAIPAATGLGEFDRKNLEWLLASVLQAWLADKMSKIRDLLEANVAGPLLDAADKVCADMDKPLSELEKAMDDISSEGLP